MDHINALFELMGAAFILPSILAALKAGRVQGVSILTPLFFWSWGAWNLLYYPSLDQWLSFSAGAVLFLVNTVWLYLVWSLKDSSKQLGQ